MDPTPRPAPPENVGKKAVRGAIWLWGRQIASNVVSLGTMAILARKVSPAEFGLVALTGAILNFISSFAQTGLGDYAVVDREEGQERRRSAAFWLCALSGVGLAVVLTAASPFIGRFYHQPILPILLAIAGFRFLLMQLALVPEALIRRELKYDTLALRDGTLDITGSIASAILALFGLGIWSLVFPAIVVSLVRVVITFRLSRFRPRAELGRDEWPRLAKYGWRMMVASASSVLVNDGDSLVVGRQLGATALGVYNVAWSTTSLLMRHAATAARSVALPSFAAFGNDPERLRSAYRRMVHVLSLVTMPMHVGLFVLADDFVLTFYGHRFAGATTALRILIVFGQRRALGMPTTSVLQVLQRTDIILFQGVATVPFYLAGIIVGSRWGITGVAVGVTITRIGWGTWYMHRAARELGLKASELWKDALRSFVPCLIMALAMMALKLALRRFSLPPAVLLAVLTPFGALAYIVALRTVCKGIRNDLLALSRALPKRAQQLMTVVVGASSMPQRT